MFCKKGAHRNFAKFTGKHLCQSLFFNKVAGLGTLAQVFSCEFCESSKNNFSYGTPLVAAFEIKEIISNFLPFITHTLLFVWHISD